MSLPQRFTDNIIGLFGEAGRQWLERLPALVGRYAQEWGLTVGPPLRSLSFHYIAPAWRTDGTEAILKLGIPHAEMYTEIEALRVYDGRGCVRLLEVDGEGGARLLERLRPGRPLVELEDDDEATRIAAGVMRRLWRPVPPEAPFPTIQRWAAGLARLRAHFEGGTGPLPPVLVEKAEALFPELLASAAEPVLLHGDLHHENILSAEREPWLAIDPKGVVGEPACEVAPLLYNMAPRLLRQPQPGRIIARRLDLLSAELGLDRARLRSWGLAQTVLSAWWCIEDHSDCWSHAIRMAELIGT